MLAKPQFDKMSSWPKDAAPQEEQRWRNWWQRLRREFSKLLSIEILGENKILGVLFENRSIFISFFGSERILDHFKFNKKFNFIE